MFEPLRLGDHCSKIGSGATPRGGKDSYLKTGPFRLIRSQNVYNSGFSKDGLVCISEEQATALSNVEVMPNDILLNITGNSVARSCQVDANILPARVNQHVAIIRPDPASIDPRFLRFFLVSPQMQALMLSYAGAGATRNALTKGMIESFRVPSVAIDLQRNIGNTLGALEDKIELNRHTNETLEAMAQALFKDLFVDFGAMRAKVEGREPYLAPDIWSLLPDGFDVQTNLPEGWEMFRMCDLAYHHKRTMQPSEFPGAVFEHFSMPAFSKGQTPALDLGETIKSNKTIIPEMSILLCKLNPEISRVWLPEPPSDYQQVSSTEFLAFTAAEPAGRSLLYCLFRDDRFRDMLKSMITGTTHQRVSPLSLLEREVLCGKADMFHHFENIADSLLGPTLANRAEARTLAQTRNFLLPKLMSGEIRLREADQIVGEVL